MHVHCSFQENKEHVSELMDELRTKLGLQWFQDPQKWAPFLYAIEAGDIGIPKVSTAALLCVMLALCSCCCPKSRRFKNQY